MVDSGNLAIHIEVFKGKTSAVSTHIFGGDNRPIYGGPEVAGMIQASGSLKVIREKPPPRYPTSIRIETTQSDMSFWYQSLS